MAAIGDQFKHFTEALTKGTLAGAGALARFLHSKLPFVLDLWNKLPEVGWPGGLVDFLKHPPRWFVGLFSGLAIWVGGWLLVRLVYDVALNAAGDVNKLLLGLAGLLGAPFLVWRTWIADRQKHIAQEELYTGLLVEAVEQLGATREERTENGDAKTVPNTEVRLGAIYALEKLARDYEPLHWPIMEILCAYVRKNAGPPRPCSNEIRATYAKAWSSLTDEEKLALTQRAAELKPFADVQAALTVIGRRSDEQRGLEEKKSGEADGAGWFGLRLNLRECHLARVDPRGLHFEQADFFGSCLESAQLIRTHLEGAHLTQTHIEQATLLDTHLEDALIAETDLGHAFRHGAHLEGANLLYAEGVTREKLERSYGDARTLLPEGLTRPENERWSRASNTRDASGDAALGV